MSKQMVSEDYVPGASRGFSFERRVIDVSNVEKLPATNDLNGRTFLHHGQELVFLAVNMSVHANRPSVIYTDPATNTVWNRPLGPAGQSVVLLDFLKVKS